MRRAAAPAVFLVLALSIGTVAAHPPDSTDHGIEASEFEKLWSGDTGGGFESGMSTVEVLTRGSDYVFSHPPESVETWNDGEHDGFSTGGTRVSVYPDGASPEDGAGGWIRDAYVEAFAVQPSTVVHVSPSRTTRYVPPDAEVLAAVDYRVELPSRWSLVDTDVETRLVASNTTLATGTGGTPSLDYSGLPSLADEFRLVSNVSVTARRGPTTSTRYVTVDKAIDVRTYEPSPVAYLAEYPDGDVGVLFYQQLPWTNYTLPNGGTVYSNWRFFSMRDTSWDGVTRASSRNTSSRHSGVHPVEVHAYPSETRTFASSETTVESVVGVETRPPELPDDVHVDVSEDVYSAAYGVDVRTTRFDSSELVTHGVLRGTREEARVVGTKTVRRSDLSLSLVDSNATHAEVRVTLRDAATGEPIDLRRRRGKVVVMSGIEIKTGDEGTATVELRKPTDAVRARYLPGRWWETAAAYTGDSATLSITSGSVSAVGLLTLAVRLVGLVLPFVFIVFFVDRLTRLDIWPPWRRL